MQRVSARNNHGTIVFSGVDGQRSRNETPERMITRRQGIQVQSSHSVKPTTRSTIVVTPSVRKNTVVSDDEDDGPNDRGTYSKEYTIKHREIMWIHRGQGRYIPESALDTLSSSQSQTQSIATSDQRGTRQSLRRRPPSTESEDDDEDGSSTARDSPHVNHLGNTPYSLRRRPSIHNQVEPIETRESRALRRSQQQSLNDTTQSTLDEDNEDKTFPRSYVDSHPEQQFRHVGNGFYRKLSITPTASQNTPDLDRTANSSQTSIQREPYSIRTRGRFARRASATSMTSTNSNATAAVSPTDQSDGSNMESLTKQQMEDYLKKHPGTPFVHRGNGRYKKLDDVRIQVAQEAARDPEDKITYDKEFVDAHPEMEFHHCGYGRYKRGPKNVQPNIVSNTEDGQEIPEGLVTKEYVEAHPEYTFHHRGQGRYALGPRFKSIRDGTGSPSPSTGDFEASKTQKDQLYDREYVDAHPQETFHHRGQGRWARGLPPPGSSNKMAVRGPGVAMTRTSTTSSASATEVQYNEEDLPGLFELVNRADGPEAFPDTPWYYRGGGKWCRSTRVEQNAHENAARVGKTKPKQNHAAPPAVSRDNSSNRRASQQGLVTLPSLKRKHSALQQDADSPSQSDTSHQNIRSIEEDQVLDEDLPQVYRRSWPQPTEEERDDKVFEYMRDNYPALNDIDEFIKLMNNSDISTRPTETLIKIATHVQQAIDLMQDEYLALDAITAPQARIPRKVATGGRLPVDRRIFEDKKEADLYDYQFDPKRIGYQDPEAQKITRDADGRELRKRRRRGDLDTEGLFDEAPLPRRVIKPVNRFDGVPGSTARKNKGLDTNKQGSVTPDRVASPLRNNLAETYVAPSSGRWANHVPKRIKELRGSRLARNDGATDSADDEDMADARSDSADI